MARDFNPERVTRELARLLHESCFAEAAGVLKRKMEEEGDAGTMMQWIERRVLIEK
jgi:hypothetical protein